MNQAVSFGLLGVGGILLTKALTGSSFADVVKGKPGAIARTGTQLATTGVAGAGAAAVNAATGATSSSAIPNAAGDVNPVPGATGSRLDQGFDVTSQKFLAPFNGTVVYSTPSDPGWQGGGYVAIENALDPSNVIYFAEGLLPTVTVGQKVAAGQQIATPRSNPYNGIVGNIEFGPANPAAPEQPLAQVVGDAAAVVNQFYAWVRGLGGPAATSTSNAGHA